MTGELAIRPGPTVFWLLQGGQLAPESQTFADTTHLAAGLHLKQGVREGSEGSRGTEEEEGTKVKAST